MHASPSTAQSLERKIADKTAVVAVIGLGYVGLPLTRVFHDAGFRVLGYDRDAAKIEKLKAGESYLKHLGGDLAQRLRASGRFTPTVDPDILRDADAIILCVPSRWAATANRT